MTSWASSLAWRTALAITCGLAPASLATAGGGYGSVWTTSSTSTSITINASAPSGNLRSCGGWKVCYKVAGSWTGACNGGTVVYPSSMPFTITGLAANTEYKIKVFAKAQKKNWRGRWRNCKYRKTGTTTQSTERSVPNGGLSFVGAGCNSWQATASVRMTCSNPGAFDLFRICYKKTWSWNSMNAACSNRNTTMVNNATRGMLSFTPGSNVTLTFGGLKSCRQYKFVCYKFSPGQQFGTKFGTTKGHTPRCRWWGCFSRSFRKNARDNGESGLVSYASVLRQHYGPTGSLWNQLVQLQGSTLVQHRLALQADGDDPAINEYATLIFVIEEYPRLWTRLQDNLRPQGKHLTFKGHVELTDPVLFANLQSDTELGGAEVVLDVEGAATGSEVGAAVAAIGDMDGDGISEIAIGSPGDGNRGAAAGTVIVHSGRDGNELFRIDGPRAGARFGSSIAAIGDVDGDGISDIAVGAPGDAGGRVFVHSGRDQRLRYVWTGATGSQFGTQVAAIGDTDGDGIAEVAIAAPGASAGAGTVSVYNYRAGAPRFSLPGTSVALLADMDGDGISEIAVGAPRDGGTGVVRVVSPKTVRVLSTTRGTAGEEFGASVAAAGDFTGDGLPDVLIGAPGANQSAGVVYAMASIPGGRRLQSVRTLAPPSPAAGARFGEQVASAGDVDRDGRPDAVVGAPQASSFTVFSGRNGEVYLHDDGDTNGRLGAAVGGGIDLDGDGADEIFVGAPGAQTNGRALVFGVVRDRSYGVGCVGSNGSIPFLATPDEPMPGGTMTMLLTEARSMTPAALMIGLGRQDFDLGLIGAPGCRWLVTNGPVLPGLTDARGAMSLSVPIPNDPKLIGAEINGQFLIIDQPANQLGVVTTPARSLTVER